MRNHLHRPNGRVAVASALSVALLAFLAGSLTPSSNAAAPCTVRVYPGIPPHHTKDLKLKPKYNSFPPTSGTHFYLPAKWSIYTYPIPQIALVHNLEHGGVAIQYGNKIPKDTVSKIAAWYRQHSNGLIVAPFPALDDKIALTAWNEPPYSGPPVNAGHGYVATCTAFDEKTYTAFINEHRYKGGERFPKALLAAAKP
jgi:hypothetical protein